MYSWFTTTIPMTSFITSITGGITIATALLSCVLKSRRTHEPERPPEFMDANAKEADTYYGMRSTVAFPVKGTKIKRNDLRVPEDGANIESNIGTKRNIQNRRVQSRNTQVQESEPVGFSMQNFFKKSESISVIYIDLKRTVHNKGKVSIKEGLEV